MSIYSWMRTNWPFGGPARREGQQYSGPDSYQQASAKPVTFDTAMQVSAFWACVRLISETVAGLPLQVYRRTESGWEVDRMHPLSVLFSGKVNRYQTKHEFIECQMLALATQGNCYAKIQRGAGGDIVSLLPMLPAQTEVKLLDDGSLTYHHFTNRGVEVLAEASVWHIKLFGNTIVGLSPLAHARNMLGLAQAAEGHAAEMYKGSLKPTGVLSMDAILTPKQRAEIRADYQALRISDDTNAPLVLEGGMKFQQVSLSPSDMQMLESRQFQTQEICRFMGVPSVLVNDTSGTTAWGSGIQQIIEGWYKLGLSPYLNRTESSIHCHLLSIDERSDHKIDFDMDALLRADQKARYDAYREAINSGWMMPNYAREKEGMPKVDGGDRLIVNGTMQPLDKVGENRPIAAVQPKASVVEFVMPEANPAPINVQPPIVNVTVAEPKGKKVKHLGNGEYEVTYAAK